MTAITKSSNPTLPQNNTIEPITPVFPKVVIPDFKALEEKEARRVVEENKSFLDPEVLEDIKKMCEVDGTDIDELFGYIDPKIKYLPPTKQKQQEVRTSTKYFDTNLGTSPLNQNLDLNDKNSLPFLSFDDYSIQKAKNYHENESNFEYNVVTMLNYFNNLTPENELKIYSKINKMKEYDYKILISFVKHLNIPKLLEFIKSFRIVEPLYYKDRYGYYHFTNTNYNWLSKKEILKSNLDAKDEKKAFEQNVDIFKRLERKGQIKTHHYKYKYLINDYAKYLAITGEIWYNIEMLDSNGKTDFLKIPYSHRVNEEYQQMVMAKFYQLEGWQDAYWKRTGKRLPYTMLTLTTYQNGSYSKSVKGKELDIFEAKELLSESYTKFIDMVRKIKKGCSFIKVYEPHKKNNSGYFHIHLIVFDEFTFEEQQRLRNLWSNKYGAGSYANGVDFSIKKPEPYTDKNEKHHDGTLSSVRNYMLKYILKSYNKDEWQTQEWLFNSILYVTGSNSYSASRDISDAMKLQKEEPEEENGINTNDYTSEAMKITQHPSEKDADDNKNGKLIWEFEQEFKYILKSLIKLFDKEVISSIDHFYMMKTVRESQK